MDTVNKRSQEMLAEHIMSLQGRWSLQQPAKLNILLFSKIPPCHHFPEALRAQPDCSPKQ